MKGRKEEVKKAEECCFSNQLQASLNTNSTKRSPLTRKMVALSFTMIFSICVCSAFLKQTETQRELHVIKVNLTENPLHHAMRINLTGKPIPEEVEVNLTKKSFPHMKEVDLNEKNLTENYLHHVVRINLTEMTVPQEMEANLTEKSLPRIKKEYLNEEPLPQVVRVHLEEQNLSNAVTLNLTDQTLAPELRFNLTGKVLFDGKTPESQIPYVDYHKLENDSRSMNRRITSILTREEKICGARPVSRYAIVSTQRSGSKWFEALLNSHGNIRSHGEIFYDVDRKCNMTVIREVLDRFYSLNWRSPFKRRRRTCVSAVGFKWMLNQGLRDNYKQVAEYFNLRGISSILLLRKNHLRRLISLKANAHDGLALNGTHQAHVHSQEDAAILGSYKPKLNVKRLLSNMDQMERLVTETQNNFRSTHHMVVYYEDLVRNQTKVMMDVLEFLGMPKRELVSGHVKIHTRPLKEQIENWSAVVKTLNRSRYKKFITDDEYEI